MRPYFDQLKALLRAASRTRPSSGRTSGLGRVVQPVKGQIAYLEEILSDPAMSNVYFDLSWDEVAKYIVASDADRRR